MKIRKRSIILLEVFLALAILTIALLPLTSFPYQYFAKEKRLLESIERERVFDLSFRETLSLLSSSIAFSEISMNSTLTIPLSDQKILSINTPSHAQIKQILPQKKVKFKDENLYKLIECEVFLGSSSQSRHFLVYTEKTL